MTTIEETGKHCGMSIQWNISHVGKHFKIMNELNHTNMDEFQKHNVVHNQPDIRSTLCDSIYRKGQFCSYETSCTS